MKQAANRLWRLHQKLKVEGCANLPPHDHGAYPALRYLRRGWSLGKPLINPTGDIRSIWYYHAGGILDLLMVGREFDATDPRDKVYSILGISEVAFEPASESIQAEAAAEEDSSAQQEQALTMQQLQRMRVDYSASISEVYQYTAKYLINRDLNLDVLCILSTHRDNNSHDLPTWTPDWRVPTSTIRLRQNWHYFNFKYAASGLTKAVLQDQSDLGRLTVQGFPIDQILALHPKSTDPPHIPDDIGFSVRDFNPESDLCVLAAMATERQICLVPTTADPGDLVFILHGAKVPFVLRLRQDRSQQESDGEAIESDQRDLRSDEESCQTDEETYHSVEENVPSDNEAPKFDEAAPRSTDNNEALQSHEEVPQSNEEAPEVGAEAEAPRSVDLVDDMEYEVIGPCWVPEEMWGHAIKDFEEQEAYLFRLVLV